MNRPVRPSPLRALRSACVIVAALHLFVAVVPCAGASLGAGSAGHHHGAMEHGDSTPRHVPDGELSAPCNCGCDAHRAGMPAGYARLGVALPPFEPEPMAAPPGIAAPSTAPVPREHVPLVPCPVPKPV